MLAVSGIDHTIKIFSPDGRAREDARKGVGITPVDNARFSSLGLGRTRFADRRTPRTGEASSANAEDSLTQEEDEEQIGPNGLSSRKRMHLEYKITSQNDVERRGGNQEAFITVRF